MISLITLLFAISLDTVSYSNMSCDDAQTLIDENADEYQKQSEFITMDDANEIVEVVKESTPECF